MPHAIVAGVPVPWARQIRAGLDAIQSPGWSFSVFPGRDQRVPGIDRRQLDALFKEADARAGAHVFGVGADRDRQAIALEIRTYFRFRWLPSDVLKAAINNVRTLVSELEPVILEENAWREALHPVEKRSPLALPQHVFAAERSVAPIWELCESFNKEAGFFASLADRIDRFRREHLKKWDRHSERFFIDHDARVWKGDGPYHGQAPFPRDWKYSSVLPAGFHFDVQHEQGRAFDFLDKSGRRASISAKGHCNVDAHGYMR